MYSSSKFLWLFVVILSCTPQQKITKPDTFILDNLKQHVQYLADDKLEGRRTGTEGEQLAMQYIQNQFKQIGLIPKGTEYYFQSFIVNDGKKIDAGTELIINGTKLEPEKDFFPFPFSSNQQIGALPVIAVRETGMPWFYDLNDPLEENKNNPHFDLNEYIYTTAKKAKDKGASAVLVYNTSVIEDKLVFNPKDRSESLTIPVLYVRKEIAQKYFKDVAAILDIKFKTELSVKNRVGYNVAGYIDNGAATTVILGAHFDHLGYGEDGNSRNTTERLIHNGADDNASGTAALIELARLLKSSSAKNNNYLFIAFSGEELGLYGSKHFVEHPTVDLNNVNYMINMDMVGRLSDSTKVLTIGGIGTSPVWGDIYKPTETDKQTMVFKYDSSGTGPSDHTSFYRKNIPVLFYFTGLHTDYHKPSDDADKINYAGEQAIIRHIYDVIQSMNNKGKLAFTKTRETQTTTNASFKVTLGIMPDYTYAGTGVRADGVTEGRPGFKAGLKAGDIILQLGDNTITSLENYMQALGTFKKGDTTKIKYKRGNEMREAKVEF